MSGDAPVGKRQRSYRVEAVVIRHNDWGEADRLLWLFTRELGKQRAIAKGVRKPQSRKAGHLEPFTRVSLQLARGRDLPIITQAEAIDLYMPVREDLLLTTYGAYVVELLDRFTYEEGENRLLYQLLVDTLDRLRSLIDPDLVVRFYEMRLLDSVGFRPQLINCVECGELIKPGDQFFSAAQGGVLCPGCGLKATGARPVSMDALRYLRHFQRSNFKEAARAVIHPTVQREMENLVQHYLTYLLEHHLNTPVFLRRIRRSIRQEDQDEMGEFTRSDEREP
jgi:DNA repair protein RecO (recombination protein O)